MIESIPLPIVDDPVDRAFWQGCDEGRLLVQTCTQCGHRQHPPRAMCPACRSMELGWQECAPTGQLWSYVVPHPPLLPAFAPLAPYIVGLIIPDGLPGIRMVGAIVASAEEGIGSVAPAEIAIGDRMRLTFVRLAEDVALPCWVPDAACAPSEREEKP
tara:strand:- start:47 stop:520 length:474 start_codon:yes stop_codon:yes gene_type:complete